MPFRSQHKFQPRGWRLGIRSLLLAVVMGCQSGIILPEPAAQGTAEGNTSKAGEPASIFNPPSALGQAPLSPPNPARKLRPAVHPRQNVEEFPPVEARFVRFNILKANQREPCLDELEIYSAGPEARNAALASAGAKASASGSFPGYKIHRLENINDGLYGNDHSWILNVRSNGWVQIELPQKTWINRIVWGRDREGKFVDRLPVEYRIEVASDPETWAEVASSADRQPLGIGSQVLINNTSLDQILNRFAPTDTTLAGDSRQPAGEYFIDVWQTDQGLPGNAVSSLVQTRDGYIWVGTFNGLARFDGLAFTVFGERQGLLNRRIKCLYEDHQGNLWVGTEGRDLFCYQNGKFTHYSIAPANSTMTGRHDANAQGTRRYPYQDSLSEDVIYCLSEDKEGNLWIGSACALVKFQNGQFTYYTVDHGLPGQDVQTLHHDREGRLWMVAGGELCQFVQGAFRSFPSPAKPFFASGVCSLLEDRAGQLWMGARNTGLVQMTDHNLTVHGEKEGLLPDDIWALCDGRGGEIWIGTGSGGLYRLNGSRFATFTTQDGLSNNSIRSVLEDREGNLWVGTNGGGLNRMKRRKLHTFTDRDGLSHNVVMSLAQDRQDNIWIGLNGGGLNVLRRGIIEPFKPEVWLNNLYVCSVCPSRDGSLWAGIWSGGLLHLKAGQTTSLGLEDGLSENVILALCEDRLGGIWIGTYSGGLNYFREGRFTHYGTGSGLAANFVTAIIQGQKDVLWIGTSGGGLSQFSSGKFHSFSRADGLGSDFVRTLYEDREGILWIGTGGGGLSRLEQGRFTNYTTQDGMLDDVVSQILEDDRGNLWIGTNKGIVRLAKRELNDHAHGRTAWLNPTLFGKSEGMEGLQCTGGFHPAGLKTRDGKLWFSTVKGLVMVDPAQVELNRIPPPVFIEQVILDGPTVVYPRLQGLAEPGESRGSRLPGRSPAEAPPSTYAHLSVPPGRQRLEFRYTALNFDAPEKVRFRYKLENLDRDWVEAGTRRAANYAHVPPGDYHFRVIACNNDGTWNTLGSSLALTVFPPWWQTWWAISLAGLVILGSVGGSVRVLELRQLRHRMERLERQHSLERERARIAQDIHDDLGASLTQIALLSELIQRNPRQELLKEHSHLISDTARQAMQAMDQIVWAVNPKNDSLDHLANYIPQFAEDFFKSTSIRCRLDVPLVVPDHPLDTETRHNLFLAVKEALNNVARHSQASEAWLRLGVETGFFFITIEDNGKGFLVKNGARQGNGLGNMRQRLESLGGRCELASQPGRGTKLTFILPLKPPPSA